MEPLLRLNADDDNDNDDDDDNGDEISPRREGTMRGIIISGVYALRHSKWTFLVYSIFACTIFTVLLSVHTFNSPPSTTFATCAGVLSSGGPCAASGGAPCILRCPPRCDDTWLDSQVYNVYGGSQDTNFSYRGDSKLCRAAIHSGALSSSGGCTILRVGKSFAFFTGGGSGSGGNIQTYNAPYFPYSLSFTKREESIGDCNSLQWPLLICLTIIIIIGFILVPAIPYVITWSAMCIFGYWYLVFTARGSDPFSSLTIGAGSFVSLAPLLFCIWKVCARVSIESAEHSLITLLIFYLFPFLAAIHMNLATIVVPDFSFDADAFSQGPKAIIFIIFLLILILAVLIYAIRLIFLTISSTSSSTAGRIVVDIERGIDLARRRRTIAFAALAYVFGIFILIFISVATRKHTSPHVHHSLLALALLPLTGSTKRPMLIAQAILCGILINGIAFWGIDGPWDYYATPPPLTEDTPLCAPFIAFADTSTAKIDWTCTPSLFGTSFALMINNVIVFNAFEPPAVLSQLPEGYNGTMQLFQMMADGTLSRGSSIVPFHS
jgi:hypothetical protein